MVFCWLFTAFPALSKRLLGLMSTLRISPPSAVWLKARSRRISSASIVCLVMLISLSCSVPPSTDKTNNSSVSVEETRALWITASLKRIFNWLLSSASVSAAILGASLSISKAVGEE